MSINPLINGDVFLLEFPNIFTAFHNGTLNFYTAIFINEDETNWKSFCPLSLSFSFHFQAECGLSF